MDCLKDLLLSRFGNEIGDQETGGLEKVETKTNGKSGFKAKKGGFV